MFKNLALAYKIATNVAKIKNVLESIYNVIVKTSAIIDFTAEQLKDSKETKLGKVLSQYVPIVQTALSKVKEVIEKYGVFVGFETQVYVQADEDLTESLQDAIVELEAALQEK
jgi:uncharacterized membrane protein